MYKPRILRPFGCKSARTGPGCRPVPAVPSRGPMRAGAGPAGSGSRAGSAPSLTRAGPEGQIRQGGGHGRASGVARTERRCPHGTPERPIPSTSMVRRRDAVGPTPHPGPLPRSPSRVLPARTDQLDGPNGDPVRRCPTPPLADGASRIRLRSRPASHARRSALRRAGRSSRPASRATPPARGFARLRFRLPGPAGSRSGRHGLAGAADGLRLRGKLSGGDGTHRHLVLAQRRALAAHVHRHVAGGAADLPVHHHPPQRLTAPRAGFPHPLRPRRHLSGPRTPRGGAGGCPAPSPSSSGPPGPPRKSPLTRR